MSTVYVCFLVRKINLSCQKTQIKVSPQHCTFLGLSFFLIKLWEHNEQIRTPKDMRRKIYSIFTNNRFQVVIFVFLAYLHQNVN